MPAAVTLLQSAGNNTGLTTYTFASQNLGTASSGRHIVLVAGARASSTTAFTLSATIQGISATSVVTTFSTGAAANRLEMFIAAVPSGTTGDVVVTCSRTAVRMIIDLFIMTGIDSATPSATTSDVVTPFTGVLTVPADGIAIASGLFAGVANSTWTFLTERTDNTLGSNLVLTTASDAFATLQSSLSITVANTGGEPGSVFAAWSPSASGRLLIPRGMDGGYSLRDMDGGYAA